MSGHTFGLHRTMKYTLFIILTSLSSLLLSQDVISECIKIDFETINGVASSSGILVDNQYQNIAGISFVLDNGMSPVLAQYGGFPAEAFASSLGNDLPIPGQIPALGEFFLTDDGDLSGLESPALIMNFNPPIDSISSYILDMDLGEEFTVEAFDLTGNKLDEVFLKAGDPGTGDGIATPWGLNDPGCEGKISQVRMKGERQTSGAFGLGMDNFTICFSGIDILLETETQVEHIFCQDSPGAINVINNSSSDLTYSIDGGVTFQSSGLFTPLNAGDYIIIIQNEDGCLAALNETVIAEGPTFIEDVIVTHTTCGEDNGTLEVFASVDGNVVYYIDALDFQSQNYFENLAPGPYVVTIIGPTGCSAAVDVVINPSDNLILNPSSFQDDACDQSIGNIGANVVGGTGQIMFSLNGGEFIEDSFFDSLPPGEYVLTAIDEPGCLRTDSIILEGSPGVLLLDADIEEAICGENTGTILLEAEGGSGGLEYSVDGLNFYSEPFFENLSSGNYNVYVQDEFGCNDEGFFSIPTFCPVYIPNVFTPDDLNFNNLFQAYTYEMQEVLIHKYLIYDRWGELMYSDYNFDIHTNEHWWDGKFQGQDLMPGVYTYLIEYQIGQYKLEIVTGDVTLLR